MSSEPARQGIVPIAVHGKAVTPNGQGYWVVTANGKVYPFGSAKFYGDVSHVKLVLPVVGIAPAPDGQGYWLSTDGRGAFQDPTHVAFYNENSFWYYTEAQYRNYVPDIQARLQVSRVVTHYPTDWHAAHHIPYVTGNLIALEEPMPRNGGYLLW